DVCVGMTVSSANKSVYIGHNQFNNLHHEAVQGYAGTLNIEENEFFNCSIAIDVSGVDLTIHRNLISGLGGIYIGSNATITQNTIDVTSYGIDCPGVSGIVEDNIIVRAGVGVFCNLASLVFRCNDIFTAGERYHGCPDPTGTNGNISADPLFCGIPGSLNFQLQSVSPCALGHHPNGDD